MADKKTKQDDFSLEEDDIFEEFETDEYQQPAVTETDASLWDPEWDEETVQDEVAQKIKQELLKNAKK